MVCLPVRIVHDLGSEQSQPGRAIFRPRGNACKNDSPTETAIKCTNLPNACIILFLLEEICASAGLLCYHDVTLQGATMNKSRHTLCRTAGMAWVARDVMYVSNEMSGHDGPKYPRAGRIAALNEKMGSYSGTFY